MPLRFLVPLFLPVEPVLSQPGFSCSTGGSVVVPGSVTPGSVVPGSVVAPGSVVVPGSTGVVGSVGVVVPGSTGVMGSVGVTAADLPTSTMRLRAL